MKKLSIIAAAALAFAASGAIAAGTATDDFIVKIDLTAACKVKTAAVDLAFTYKAFDPATFKTTKTEFECSRGLTPKFKFDNTGTDQTGEASVALATAVKGEGVIAGIRYVLSGATSKSATGGDAKAGLGATAGSDGTADVYTVDIRADIAQQAGDASGALTGSHTRVLTIEY